MTEKLGDARAVEAWAALRSATIVIVKVILRVNAEIEEAVVEESETPIPNGR